PGALRSSRSAGSSSAPPGGQPDKGGGERQQGRGREREQASGEAAAERKDRGEAGRAGDEAGKDHDGRTGRGLSDPAGRRAARHLPQQHAVPAGGRRAGKQAEAVEQKARRIGTQRSQPEEGGRRP